MSTVWGYLRQSKLPDSWIIEGKSIKIIQLVSRYGQKYLAHLKMTSITKRQQFLLFLSKNLADFRLPLVMSLWPGVLGVRLVWTGQYTCRHVDCTCPSVVQAWVWAMNLRHVLYEAVPEYCFSRHKVSTITFCPKFKMASLQRLLVYALTQPH